MGWFRVSAAEVQEGDRVMVAEGDGIIRPGESWRVSATMEPNAEYGWSRGFELSRWVDVGEDEWFEVERREGGSGDGS